MGVKPKGRVTAALARFRRDSTGATAVEFAIVGAPFFFLIGSILEMGVMLFTEYRLQNGVEAAARLIRTGQPSITTGPQFVQTLCSQTFNIPNCSERIAFVIVNADRFEDINMPPLAQIGPGQRVFTLGSAKQPMAIVATVDWRFILPHMQLLSNVDTGAERRLQGIAVFQNEPYEEP
jgi:Flp pilus assembly protein TadG